jgi:arsenate reductase
MTREKVIFLCTGNSCRSQMAEGFLRHMAGDRFEVFSAGLEPRELNPLAVKVMAERNIDISGQQSKSIENYLGRESFQHAIFVCRKAEENCPSAYPFALTKYSWSFDDPAATTGDESTRVAGFRRVRDEIEKKIHAWLTDLEQE